MPDVVELGTELGIRAWSGRAVFTTSLSRGTSSSPISVSSSSTPSASPSRPSSSSSPLPKRQPTPELRSDITPERKAAQTTPITTTPTRPRARILYSPSPVRPPAPRQPVHPFFAQVRVPPAHTPRLVANYASTSTSESASGSQSQSQSMSSQSQTMSTVSEFGDEITAEMMAAVDRFSALAIDSKPASRTARPRPSLPRLLPRASLPPSPDTFTLGQTEAPVADDLPAPTSRDDIGSAPDVSDLATAAVGSSQRRTDTDRLTASPEPIEPTASADAAAAPLPPEPLSDLPLFTCKTPLAGHFDRPPTVVYTSDPGEADDLVSCLHGVLGFDMEWPPPGVGRVRQTTRRDGTVGYTRDGLWDPVTRTYSWPQGRTAVIQVCDARTVIVFHLRGKTAPGPVLAKLIADGAHVKVGVVIRGDAQKLVRDFPAQFTTSPPAGLLDLSTFAKNVEPGAWKGVRSVISMARLAARYLGATLSKDQGVRTGAWDAKMTAEQLEYAANDAYASLLIFNEINRRARASGVAVDIPTLTTSLPGPQKSASAAGATKRAPTTSGVSPAKSRALRLFTDGDSVAQLSVSLGVKETTVQGYIVDAAQVVSIHDIRVDVRRRMLLDVPEHSYTGQKHKGFLDKVRASLEG